MTVLLVSSGMSFRHNFCPSLFSSFTNYHIGILPCFAECPRRVDITSSSPHPPGDCSRRRAQHMSCVRSLPSDGHYGQDTESPVGFPSEISPFSSELQTGSCPPSHDLDFRLMWLVLTYAPTIVWQIVWEQQTPLLSVPQRKYNDDNPVDKLLDAVRKFGRK